MVYGLKEDEYVIKFGPGYEGGEALEILTPLPIHINSVVTPDDRVWAIVGTVMRLGMILREQPLHSALPISIT